ncbi:MAG: hypothetical protein ACLFQV_04910 [Vulcanimicrobiota bacterium]
MSKIKVNNSYDNIIQVYQKSVRLLQKKPGLLKHIGNLVTAYKEIEFLIPINEQKLLKGEFAPYHYSYSEMENSYQLAMLGFYRHSFIALKRMLDLGMESIYENCFVEKKNTWLLQETSLPGWEEIWKKTTCFEGIKNFSLVHEMERNIYGLRNELEKLTKSRELTLTDGKINSHINYFNESLFDKWLELLEKTVRNLIVLHLLRFPPGIIPLEIDQNIQASPSTDGFLRPDQVEIVKNVLENKYIKEVESFNLQNGRTRRMLSIVKNLPAS